MGSDERTRYCSFTKAIEHLGDRWTLLILRDLALRGPQGYNGLAAGLPGRISRSVLSDRLRRLETLGLVARPGSPGEHPPYRLTHVGSGLTATLLALRDWAETWLPDDPAMVERDPDVVLAWLAARADPERLPERPVVIEVRPTAASGRRYWLVLEGGAVPFGCLTDPLLDERRYLYVDLALPTLLALARGRCGWHEALADGSATLSGDPSLLRDLPGWFRAVPGTSVPFPVTEG